MHYVVGKSNNIRSIRFSFFIKITYQASNWSTKKISSLYLARYRHGLKNGKGNVHKGRSIFGYLGISSKIEQDRTRQVVMSEKIGHPIYHGQKSQNKIKHCLWLKY